VKEKKLHKEIDNAHAHP